MRAPPPVEFRCVLGRAWRAALSSLAGLSAAVPLAWGLPVAAAQWADPPGSPLAALGIPLLQGAVVLAVALMTSGAFWLASRRFDTDERTLRWDGQDWVLAGRDRHSDQRGDAALMLDLGPWLLVRFAPAATGSARAAVWFALAADGDAARWAALRGALWNWRAHAGDARP
jgi:hypothetical protein